MSKTEVILTRAMNDAEFADLLFNDPEKALAEYSLSGDELAIFRGLSRAGLDAFASSSLEERKSLASAGIGRLSSTDGGMTW